MRVLLSRHAYVACNLHCVTRSSFFVFCVMTCVRSVLFYDDDQTNKEEEEEEKYPPEVLTLPRVVL